MNNIISDSDFFGVLISIAAFEAGLLIKKKFRLAIFNLLHIAIVIVIAFLLIFHIDYNTYYVSAKYIDYLLTPATICLAITLYRKLGLLKNNWKAILIGISSGVLSNLGCIFGLSP